MLDYSAANCGIEPELPSHAAGPLAPRTTLSGHAATTALCPFRVESRCDAVALGSSISVATPFVRWCLTGSTMAPFSHPAHRTGQADFPHPACMGLSLSRGRHAILRRPLHSIFLFDPSREHSSVPTAYCHRRRAQRRSRTALLQRRRRLVLDGREHGGRLPAIGWLAAR